MAKVVLYLTIFQCGQQETHPPEEALTEEMGNVYCTQDVKQCPDGSYVGRNPANNCNFYPCPDPDDSERQE